MLLAKRYNGALNEIISIKSAKKLCVPMDKHIGTKHWSRDAPKCVAPKKYNGIWNPGNIFKYY